jgi:Domain of unknown function (DUF4397)
MKWFELGKASHTAGGARNVSSKELDITMNNQSNIVRAPLGLLLMTNLVLTVSCGNGGTSQVRLLNASPGESALTASLAGTTIGSGVQYGTASSYTSVTSGSPTLSVTDATTSNVIINQSISLGAGGYYTILAGNYSSAINATVLTDNNSTPASGSVSIRIVNASPLLGTADVYVLAPGTNLINTPATVSSLNFESASSYLTLNPGSYEVYFTQPGQKAAIIDSGALTFTSEQIRTVVGLDGQSGGYTTAVLPDLN